MSRCGFASRGLLSAQKQSETGPPHGPSRQTQIDLPPSVILVEEKCGWDKVLKANPLPCDTRWNRMYRLVESHRKTLRSKTQQGRRDEVIQNGLQQGKYGEDISAIRSLSEVLF
eukprot:5637193-Amphidinium_carterae.1